MFTDVLWPDFRHDHLFDTAEESSGVTAVTGESSRGGTDERRTREPFRIRGHIGMIIGLFLGALAVLAVIGLALLGDEQALTLLVVIVVGLGLIALGTRMRG